MRRRRRGANRRPACALCLGCAVVGSAPASTARGDRIVVGGDRSRAGWGSSLHRFVGLALSLALAGPGLGGVHVLLEWRLGWAVFSRVIRSADAPRAPRSPPRAMLARITRMPRASRARSPRSARPARTPCVACNRMCIVQLYIPIHGINTSVVDPKLFLHGISYL